MSLYGQYDQNNIFAKIIKGEIPCYKIYEDEETLAFLDLFPQSYGHTLVISKTSMARNLLEVEPQDLAQIMASVKKVAAAINTQLKPDGIQICQFNGEAAGQTVFHLHFHIIPRFTGEDLSLHAGKQANAEDLANLQQKLSQSF